MRLIGRGEVQLDTKPQAKSHPTSENDLCRLVLEIIEEQSPCSQSMLFVLAISRGLPIFGGGPLADFKKLLSRCVRELKARGLVQIDGGQLLVATASAKIDLTSEFGQHEVEDVLELTPDLELCELDEILDLTPELERHEFDDVLELTPELELRPSVATSKPDEAAMNRGYTIGRKGAPEPTKEEIIAAMRRFISDD
jgi:hypothetical protein